MNRIPLHTRAWTVRAVGAVGDLSRVPEAVRDRVIAGVPARLLPEVGTCVHTDLMDAGVIPDAAVGDNELAVEWVSWTDWCYECVFEAEASLLAHHEIELAFESLDTIAAIELNGVRVGTAASEFIPWRFPVRGAVRVGTNTLRVTFTSPLRHAYELAKEHGRPHNGDESAPPWHPFNMLRKCASNFGWDWGPRVATCGITGDAWLEAWSDVRSSGPPVFTMWPRRDEESGLWFTPTVTQEFRWLDTSNAEDASVCNVFGLPGSSTAEDAWDGIPRDGTANVRSTDFAEAIFASHAWNPTGLGPPHLINVTTVLRSRHVSGPDFNRTTREQERFSWRTGVRSAEWDDGTLWINGRPVFCKGANWIPEGLWPRDRTRDKLRKRLEQAKAAGMNMIRVWGGGRYESDAFYEICDELGLMVWQDFMFACALYPEEEPFRSLVEAEARHQVARLSKHPCVVLWCGGNENHWAYESWGFKERLKPGQTWGKGYWQELLPRIVQELAPHTPYVPDSPWSPPPTHPNDAGVGDRHTWDLFGPEFLRHVPRFCSEFGVQSPSNAETLAEAGLIPPPPPIPPQNQSADAPRAPDSTPPTPDNGALLGSNGVLLGNIRPLLGNIGALLGNIRAMSADSGAMSADRAPLSGNRGALSADRTLPSADGRAPSASAGAPPTPPLTSLLRRQRGPGGMTRWYDEMFAKAAPPTPTPPHLTIWPFDHLTIWESLPAWHTAAQTLQADFLFLSIVWLRANWPACGGALVWQLNDAWPGFSWSLIDSAGREKPAYHAVKAAFADRLAVVLPFDEAPTPTLTPTPTPTLTPTPHAVFINDTDSPWTPTTPTNTTTPLLNLTMWPFDHVTISTSPPTVPPRSVVRVPL